MVAMTVFPTDAADGSVANESRWRKMARQWLPSGVCPGVGGLLAPSLAFPNLTVQDGAAWVDGHYAELTGPQVLTVTATGIVVVRFDPAANTAELLYRDGVTTPTENPTGVWELVIASMSGSVLTDRRSFGDTTRFYAQGFAMTNTPVGTVSPGTIVATIDIGSQPFRRTVTANAWTLMVPTGVTSYWTFTIAQNGGGAKHLRTYSTTTASAGHTVMFDQPANTPGVYTLGVFSNSAGATMTTGGSTDFNGFQVTTTPA